MALRPKTSLLQVRIDPQLLVRFQLYCEDHNITASDAIRRMIMMRIADDDKRRERQARSASTT